MASAAPAAPVVVAPPAPSGWAAEDIAAGTRRPLYAHVQVSDLQRHLQYLPLLGLTVLHQDDHSALLGFSQQGFKLRVTQAPAGSVLDLGAGFGHFGVAMPDVYKACADIKAKGGKVTREAGPVKGGRSVIAFVEDPQGYKWELIQREVPGPEPLCQVMLRVGDLQHSCDWLARTLGMALVRQRDTPEYKYSLGFMGYGPEETSAVIECTYNYGTTEYTKGNAYNRVVLSTGNVEKTATELRAAGVEVTQSTEFMGQPHATVVDPDGYTWTFVQA